MNDEHRRLIQDMAQPESPMPHDDGLTPELRKRFEGLAARHEQAVQARDERARTHIKAVLEAMKETADDQTAAAPAGPFISGMLTGLVSALEILDGGTAEKSMETVNTRLAATIGEAYLAGKLPPRPPTTDAQDHDHELTLEQQVRGVQGWMAMDLHQALGLPVDNKAAHQGHASWATWWATLCARVAQRTRAAHARASALASLEELTTRQGYSTIALTRGLGPEPDDLFFPISYGATIAEPHPASPNDPPYMIDLTGYADGDPLHEQARRLIIHRSLIASLVEDLGKLGGTADLMPEASAAELTQVDALLRDCGVEGELGARGVHTLATAARSRLEDLVRTEKERDGAYRERAHLVALLAEMEGDAVIVPAPDIDEDGWSLLFLTLGGQQASWHISPRDIDLFNHVERVYTDDPRARWDGHTTEEKYSRIAAYTAALARCSGAPSEQHTEGGTGESTRNR